MDTPYANNTGQYFYKISNKTNLFLIFYYFIILCFFYLIYLTDNFYYFVIIILLKRFLILTKNMFLYRFRTQIIFIKS